MKPKTTHRQLAGQSAGTHPATNGPGIERRPEEGFRERVDPSRVQPALSRSPVDLSPGAHRQRTQHHFGRTVRY
jgi:hypothetical protein